MSENGKEKVPGVELVLNGGRKEMDSATIPIQWFFSPEVIARQPVHLVFFEQDATEKDAYDVSSLGRRYACRVSEGTKFIQLFSPGYHRLMVLVLSERGKKDGIIEQCLATALKDNYTGSLSWTEAADGSIARKNASWLLAATVVEFYVPAELFARKPETPFQKAVWQWVNLWHKGAPRDECEYRKRKIFAFTLKPLFWLVHKILILIGWVIVTVGYCSYLVVASGVVLFAGYRPKPMGESLRKLFFSNEPVDWKILRYRSYDMPREESLYRVWRVRNESCGDAIQRMWLAPWEVCAIFLLPGVLCYSSLLTEMLSAFVTLGVVTFLLCAIMGPICRFGNWVIKLVSRLNKKTPEENKRKLDRQAEKDRRLEEAAARRKAEAEELNRQRAQRYQNWLAGNFSLERKTEKVDLDNLPAPLDPVERTIQVFRVSFWALKAKICRPYSRR